MVYILQTRLWDGSWEASGTDENGETQTHPDAASATQDLEAHLGAMRDAVRRGDMTDYNPEDWRIQEVRDANSGS
jgi:hypothetical protein